MITLQTVITVNKTVIKHFLLSTTESYTVTNEMFEKYLSYEAYQCLCRQHTQHLSYMPQTAYVTRQ